MERTLYLITNRFLAKKPFLQVIEESLVGGVDIVQLREKDLPEDQLLELAYQLRKLTYKHGKRLIINNFPNIAAEVDADGVHFGQGVKSCPMPGKLVGASVHNLQEGLTAWRERVDYLLASHIFPTECKAELQPKGVELLEEIHKAIGREIPLIALGGVKTENLKQLTKRGFTNVAVMSEIMAANQPAEKARQLKQGLVSVC